jgi:hypothetical protein
MGGVTAGDTDRVGQTALFQILPDPGHLLRCHTTPTTLMNQRTRHSRVQMTKPY